MAMLSLLTAVAAPPVARGAEPIPAFGFTNQIAISGLSLPTAVAFAANGHVFVAEKSGIIKRFTSLADLTPDITADLRLQVFNYADKGLLGLAVDPQFPQRPYVYALFAYDALIGGTAPKWGSETNGGNDVCRGAPNGPGGDGCTTSGRLVRLTVGTNGVSTAQRVLVEDWCAQFTSHSIGTVAFGPDGYLYAGGGEGASFSLNNLDYGQYGGTVINPLTDEPYTPKNPCGDPPAGVGGTMTLPTAQGGSLRSQDKRSTNDSTGLAGTIIRVDPDTGLAAPTNPSVAGGRDENDRRIIAYGLRNPYRFGFRPGTNEVWIGDVGSYAWEEFNRIVDPTNVVRNFGWPCYEGAVRNPLWDNINATLCEDLYAAGTSAVRDPYFAFRQGQPVYAGDPCPATNAVISGVAFYTGGAYPARLDNAMFFADYARRCIWAIRAGADGVPDPTRIEVIEQDSAGPVDMKVGPGGDIFYVDLVGGAIRRLVYTAGNQSPTIVATATPTTGPAPLTVNFNASGSTDPDGDPITFAWDLDGDTQFDDSTSPTPTRNYAAGTWQPAVRVSDNQGGSSTKSFTISSGNTPPVPVIDTPAAGALWNAGQTVTFSGHATDPEQGTLGASRLSWRVILHHCSPISPTDCHGHTLQDSAGVASGSFQAIDHDLPAHLELRLTATDAGGLSTTVSRLLNPRTVDLTFASNPSGLTVSGGSSAATPFTRTFIVNSAVGLDAPTPQTLNGATYAYSSWSDGGARNHTINAPATARTYTANYSATTFPADAPGTCAGATTTSAQGSWLYNTLSSKSDIDWYRFNVPSQTWARIVLGGLPSNYRLDLYSACGTLVASSDRGTNQSEEIYRELPAGTYRVRVKRSADAVNKTVPYGVHFNSLSTGVKLLTSSAWTDSGGNLNVDGEVLNNTPDKYRLVRLTAKYYDSANVLLMTQSDFAYINVMPGRSRSPFRVTVTKPAGYDHYTVDITYSEPTTAVKVQNLVVSSSSVVNTPGPSFRGNFTNQNNFRAHYTNSVVTLYDTWATVINVRWDWTSPSSIAAGGAATYNSTFTTHYAGWNRGVVVLQATPP